MKNLKIARHATWTELFFDLIFVVAIAKAAHVLVYVSDGQIKALTYVKYLLIMVPLWWAWTGATLYANRFDQDDFIQRMLSFLQMFMVIIMAANINLDFDTYYRGFLLSYVGIRAVTVLMYLRTSIGKPDARPVSNFLASAFSVGILISLTSLMFDGLTRYAVLYAGIAFDIVMPLAARKRLRTAPVNAHHLPERFGLLTIILFGESILGLAKSFESITWTPMALSMAGTGFILVCALWWLYFENIERRIVGKILGHGQAVIYAHLLIYLGLGGIAAMVGFSVIPELSLEGFKILSALSVFSFIVALQFLHLVYESKGSKVSLIRNAALFSVSFFLLLVFAPSIPIIMFATAALATAYAWADYDA